MGDRQYDEELDTKEEVVEPGKFRVLLHNDDFTPMDFVVDILVSIFQKDIPSATKLMFDVHRRGKATAGIYTYDLAASKVDRVHREASDAGYPLKASYEPV